MDFVPIIAAIALVWKVVDTVKFALAGEVRSVVIQAATWAAGVVVMLLLASSDFGNDVEVADRLLGDMNTASLILIGLSIASTASVGVDLKKAFDNTDSAHVP